MVTVEEKTKMRNPRTHFKPWNAQVVDLKKYIQRRRCLWYSYGNG